MKIQDAYTEWSLTYDQDRNLTRDLDHSVMRAALSGLRCEAILEIGCGTGKNTGLLAEIGQRVYALDFSRGMIEKAKARHALDNLMFAVADITQSWPCKDQSIDLIVCNLVLEHISDLSLIFSESSRVLMSAGRLFISELHPFRQYQGTQANFQRNHQTTLIPPFVHITLGSSLQGQAEHAPSFKEIDSGAHWD
jgi:malonyl-CoA O-methyltransferase